MSRYYDEKKANPGAPGGVYSSDHAGMPKEKVMKEYPKAGYGMPDDGYYDTSQGIDMFADQNGRRMKKQIRKASDA